MNFTRALVIFFITLVSVSAFRMKHPQCLGTFLYRYINSKIGWIGHGALWTQNNRQLHNITIEIILATETPSDPNYLGQINMLHFHKLRTTLSRDRWNVFFEVKFPRQVPIPDVTGILLNGKELCNKDGNYTSSKPVKIRLFLEYNDHTKEERHHAIYEVPPTDDQYIECGTVNSANIHQPLVYIGETIRRGTWPWLVSIFLSIGSKYNFQCGSTLISRKVILTAAHCFFDTGNIRMENKQFIFILGMYNLMGLPDKKIKILNHKSINIFSEYVNGTEVNPHYDIAVVVLAESVRYTTFIRPACLWKESTSKRDLVGLSGFMAGWGNDENGTISHFPKRAVLPVVSDEECLQANVKFHNLISETTFCAGWRNGTAVPCTGDSGSGLLFRRNEKWVLRGIVSMSISDEETSKSCHPKEYTVFLDIFNFLSWIEGFITPDND
ncbi:hypothetical protein DMENIID0001_143220 [Sergentomyia squamirostris]